MASNDHRNIGGQPAQCDDVKGLKGIVRSFGSQDTFSNGNDGVFWPKRSKKTRNGRGCQPWEAQACHPSPFWDFLAEKGQITPKRIEMTTLGSPRLSSQSVSGFSGQTRPKNPKTDCDDNPGKPRLLIPIRFGVFLPKRAKKPRHGLG